MEQGAFWAERLTCKVRETPGDLRLLRYCGLALLTVRLSHFDPKAPFTRSAFDEPFTEPLPGAHHKICVLWRQSRGEELRPFETEKAFLQIYGIGAGIGRSLAAPPDVPKERVNVWRVALMKMLDDPNFKAAVQKGNIRLDPLDGASMAKSLAIDSAVLFLHDCRGIKMRRFVEGADRGQSTLFPECLEDWIGEDNPVRVIDARAWVQWGRSRRHRPA